MDHRAFDPGKVFDFLENASALFGPYRLPSIEPAWDAAWVVCLTRDPRHEWAARAAFASVIVDVDRLSRAPGLPQTESSATSVMP